MPQRQDGVPYLGSLVPRTPQQNKQDPRPTKLAGYCVRLIIPRQYGGGLLAVRSTRAQYLVRCQRQGADLAEFLLALCPRFAAILTDIDIAIETGRHNHIGERLVGAKPVNHRIRLHR